MLQVPRSAPPSVADKPSDEFKRRWMGMPTGRSEKMHAALANQEPPAWMRLSRGDVAAAKQFAAHVANEYPAETADELIWCLLVEATRPRKRGRKARWNGLEGLALVSFVNDELRSCGASTHDRKAVRQAIAIIRERAPGVYGTDKRAEERLRESYYRARRHAEFFVGGG